MVSAELSSPTVGGFKRANRIVQQARDTSENYIQVSKIDLSDLAIVGLGGSSFANLRGGKTRSGHVILATTTAFLSRETCPVTVIDRRSRRIPRVCISTLQSEAYTASDCMSAICWVREPIRSVIDPDYNARLAGSAQGWSPNCTQITDAAYLYDHVTEGASLAKEERTRYSVLALK